MTALLLLLFFSPPAAAQPATEPEAPGALASEEAGGAPPAPEAPGAAPSEEAGGEEARPTAPEAPPPSRPYSIPWNLRPLPVVNLARIDQSIGFHDRYGPAEHGVDGTFAQLFTIGLRAADWLMLMMRGGWTYEGDANQTAPSNFLLGANIATLLAPDVRFNVFVGVTSPMGAAPGAVARGGRLVRAAMDNAMFFPQYVAGIVGVAAAWIDGGWTVHGEATLFVLDRVVPGVPDEAIVNATFGFHVGYFVLPQLTVSGELHHQQLLSSPAVLTRPGDYGEDLRSQSSMTLGVRGHLHVDGSLWIRPGLAYTLGFDNPLIADAWQIIQVDVPILF